MPSILFYYRDGVSEGEYQTVLEQEGSAIEGDISIPRLAWFFQLITFLQRHIVRSPRRTIRRLKRWLWSSSSWESGASTYSFNFELELTKSMYPVITSDSSLAPAAQSAYYRSSKDLNWFHFLNHYSTRDQSGNVSSGLCVDTEISSAHNFDFYLQSHCGLKGSA